MCVVEQIKPDNFEKVKSIYEDFKNKAAEEYNYDIPPIEFGQFTRNIEENRLNGLVLSDNSTAKGLLIYSHDEQGAVEINVIHVADEQKANAIRTGLLENLSETYKLKDDWKVISYPMLGKQDSFVRDIALLGFQLVGQSVVRFDFKSTLPFRIFKKAQIPQIGDCKLSTWDEKHKKQTVELVHLAFKNTKNAQFEPRFSTIEGTEHILEMILNNCYGTFLSSHSRLLIREETVEGVCLVTMVEEDKLNIPIIAVRKDSRNKGVGKFLLKSIISGFYKLIGDKKVVLSEINATTDTDNYPAVNMYRRLGFKEDFYYPHSYLKK